ncbi:MAG TPA: SDR family oxidoreductase [Trebonia sp.]|nr:SDR family oxidoreductase [Trebonia sp.]
MIAGEFGCSLMYQLLHGPWRTPRYNKTAFDDHPEALHRAGVGETMSATRPLTVVTGAGTGIGASIAGRLAPDHDLLLTHLHDDADLAAVAERATRTGASVTTIAGDPRTVRGLFSNAGAYPRVPWHDHDPATFARQIDVNLLTHAAVMHLLTPRLTVSGTGRIVAVSSVLTQLGRIDLAGYRRPHGPRAAARSPGVRRVARARMRPRPRARTVPG